MLFGMPFDPLRRLLRLCRLLSCDGPKEPKALGTGQPILVPAKGLGRNAMDCTRRGVNMLSCLAAAWFFIVLARAGTVSETGMGLKVREKCEEPGIGRKGCSSNGAFSGINNPAGPDIDTAARWDGGGDSSEPHSKCETDGNFVITSAGEKLNGRNAGSWQELVAG